MKVEYMDALMFFILCSFDRWEIWDHLDQLEILMLSQLLGMCMKLLILVDTSVNI